MISKTLAFSNLRLDKHMHNISITQTRALVTPIQFTCRTKMSSSFHEIYLPRLSSSFLFFHFSLFLNFFLFCFFFLLFLLLPSFFSSLTFFSPSSSSFCFFLFFTCSCCCCSFCSFSSFSSSLHPLPSYLTPTLFPPHHKVIDYGWPENLAPPLERLCTVCKSIDSFLNAAPQNVVVLHCKGGLGRLAGVLSAYIDFSNIYSRWELFVVLFVCV